MAAMPDNMKFSNEELADLLRSVIEDRPLMALIKQRYVPFTFIVKRIATRPGTTDVLLIADALLAMRPGNDKNPVLGIYNLDVHFQQAGEVFYVGGGTLSSGRGHVEVAGFDRKNAPRVLNAENRQEAKRFASTTYAQLTNEYETYQKVLRACELTTSLEVALQRLAIDKTEWSKLKSSMNRHGLMEEPVFAKQVTIAGMLVKELEQRYIGQRLEDIIPRMLQELLSKEPAIKPAISASLGSIWQEPMATAG